ncbi:MAG: AsmA-like C-terminal region-containing protein [Bacteroidales bacterium]
MFKKILRITLSILLVLLLLIIILPYAFRGVILDRVKNELNEQLEAEVGFERLRLSLLRDFPDVSVMIEELTVINEIPFEGDTLAAIHRASVTIDLRSLWREGYEIKRIRLDRPDLRLRFLEDRGANWDIVPTSETVREEPAEPADFRLALRSIQLEDARIFYHDDVLLTYIDVNGLSGVFRGDLTQDVTTLRTQDTGIESLNLRYDRFPILSDINVRLTAELEMDMRDWLFTFRDNEFWMNELPLQFDGVIGLPEEGGTSMDVSFSAARSDFAAFLSMIPAMYTGDFDKLESAGTLALNGRINGLLKDEQIPGFDLSLEVDDGMFRYPDLPSAVSDVEVDAHIANTGSTMDEVEVDVPVLRMMLGENPVEARFAMRTPESDPWVDMALHGRVNLGEVGGFFPLEEGTELSGMLESTMEARGYLSALDRGEYDSFHATGGLQADGVRAVTAGLTHPLEMERLEADFRPSRFNLTDFRARMGDSELSASGHIDNMLHYLMEGQMLSGHFDVYSSNLNLNQLFEDMPEEAPDDEPMELTVIKVPGNVNLSLSSRVDRMQFGSMDLANLRGEVQVVDQMALLDELRMELLGGELALNGSYRTVEADPEISLGLDFSSFDFREAFNTFNTVRVLAPIGEYVSALVSGQLSIDARLDETLRPRLESLTGRGNLQSSAVGVTNHPALVTLAERVHMDMFRELSLRDLLLRFSFADGKVETDPFDFSFGQSQAVVSGSTWFDRRIDYVLRLDIPREQFGSRANQMLDDLVSQAYDRGLDVQPGERVQLDVKIGGMVTSPEVSVGLPGMIDEVRDRLKDEAERLIRQEVDEARERVEEEVQERTEDTREEVSERLEERARQVIEEAEQRAESIRREASRTADRVREEAREQAEKLLEEASGPIARAAARRAGDALIREADRRAGQLEDEADTRATRLVEEAKIQAERIRQGEEE